MSADARQLRHVVLLGDSILDNGAYTGGAPDVAAHVRRLLPEEGWRVTLCARDGTTVAGLGAQLAAVPADATHLVIAVGGNDALQNVDLLTLRVTSGAEALRAFAGRLATFEAAYRDAIGRAAALGRKTTVCTVYNGAIEDGYAVPARVGVALFTDVILRTAVDLGVDALELRSICTEPADYVNAIEPSGQGGLKIARAIARLVGAAPGPAPTGVWGSGPDPDPEPGNRGSRRTGNP